MASRGKRKILDLIDELIGFGAQSHTEVVNVLPDFRADVARLLPPPRPRPEILLDIDGVFADFVSPTLPVISEMVGRPLTLDDVTHHKMEELFGLNADQRIALYRRWGERGFCTSLASYAGAGHAVAELSKLGDVYALTQPLPAFISETWSAERERWLGKVLGIIPNRIISTGAKHMVDGDILVEDNLGNLRAWMERHPHGIGILFDRPYNQDPTWTGHRVSSLTGLVTVIEHELMEVAS